jgi:hypothetical protein
MNARKWLRENGYDDIASLIDEIINEWRLSGNGTRRNWWDTLGGRDNGQPCIVAGREFPVLLAAQIRQGKPVTQNAICLNPDESIPSKTIPGRWKDKHASD